VKASKRAPCSKTNCLTIVLNPLLAAKCNGVIPCLFLTFTNAFDSSSISTTSSCPSSAAMWSAAWPLFRFIDFLFLVLIYLVFIMFYELLILVILVFFNIIIQIRNFRKTSTLCYGNNSYSTGLNNSFNNMLFINFESFHYWKTWSKNIIKLIIQ